MIEGGLPSKKVQYISKMCFHRVFKGDWHFLISLGTVIKPHIASQFYNI